MKTMTDKTLYHITGKYKYKGQWNDIPCEYFYAYPNTKVWVLKNMIAKHLGLIRTEASYIMVHKENIKEVVNKKI